MPDPPKPPPPPPKPPPSKPPDTRPPNKPPGGPSNPRPPKGGVMAVEWTPAMHAWVDRQLATMPPPTDEQCERAARIVASSLLELREAS